MGHAFARPAAAKHRAICEQRTGPDAWIPLGRPEYLIQQAHKSLRHLGVERIDLWQLHRIDSRATGRVHIRPDIVGEEAFFRTAPGARDGLSARASCAASRS